MIHGRFELGYHSWKLLDLFVMFAMRLTGFLFEDGSQDDGLVDSVCIEGHVVCAAHMINPQLFVSLGQVIGANVGGRAQVQSAGWTILQESGTEPLAVTLWHGHVSCCSVDDVSDATGIVFLWTLSAIVSWVLIWG